MTGEVRTPDPAAAEGGVQVDEAAVGGVPTDPEGNVSTGPAGTEPAGPVSAASDELAELQAQLQTQLDERTADLQRLSAEYANYRRRVDRDRQAVIDGAKAQFVIELLGVVDDIERADAHGDLTGPFKTVADKLTAVLNNQGLVPFGAVGDEFEPAVHEAVQHDTSPDVTGPTVTTVLRRGYKIGDRVVRSAMVAVTDADPDGADPVDSEGYSVGEQASETS